MPNDFAPVLGHKFTFRTDPAPGFDGIVRCEVMEIDPPRRLVYSWQGGPLNTIVTYVLEAIPGGTRIHFTHDGFEGIKQRLIGGMMGRGWKRMMRHRLPAVLDRMDEAGTLQSKPPAADIRCHKNLASRLRVALIALVPGSKRRA
jgi:hypothetical protein